jgi:trk system potassium uptake protein TrkH
MNLKMVLNTIGIVLIFISLFMILPVVVSLVYDQTDTIPLMISCLITFISGTILFFLTGHQQREEIRHRDAFLVVTLGWMSVALFGAIPYLLTGTFDSFSNAYFESMAGFTTTGSSVLNDIESASYGILFWRSLTQWLGGMGIILFALAILPLLGTGGMQLFKAEVPEISVDKLRPRIIDTAKALWFIYFGLTCLAAAFFLVGGMDFFNAVCHAFTTMATGGFSTKNASMASFQSPFIEYTASIFMLLAGINYSLYFHVFRGKTSRLWKSTEFKFYMTIVAIATILVAFGLWKTSYDTVGDSLRYAFFQVSSIMTTTGYSTANFEEWVPVTKILLIISMFFGGMIGSTGGGIKQVRILLMLKQGYREIYQLIHPHAVTTVKLDERNLNKEILGSIWGFLFLFILVCVVAIIGMAAIGNDMITSATTVISAMCNVGPALGTAGPAENYATIPLVGKWILVSCMLIGRLEIYTVLILLVPQFWKK